MNLIHSYLFKCGSNWCSGHKKNQKKNIIEQLIKKKKKLDRMQYLEDLANWRFRTLCFQVNPNWTTEIGLDRLWWLWLLFVKRRWKIFLLWLWLSLWLYFFLVKILLLNCFSVKRMNTLKFLNNDHSCSSFQLLQI